MQIIRKINDELAISGQITPNQLPQIVQEGFQSVLNLREPDEAGFFSAEQQYAELMGLRYVNQPLATDAVMTATIMPILQHLHQMPKPILIHCDNAMRSAAVALIYLATRQGATLEQAFQQAQALGLFGTLTQV
jgi:uncharacterized protein (TIGR01244 family)